GRLPRWMQAVEGVLYRLAGVQPDEDMPWRRYALALLLFNFLGFLAVYGLQRIQPWLPLNPQGMGAVSPDSAFNTAVSFVTNTDWQGYAGESSMAYLTQMLALTVQNFLSAATGIAVVFALVRGFAGRLAQGIGNFWVDLTRITLWLLLPLSVVFALVRGFAGRLAQGIGNFWVDLTRITLWLLLPLSVVFALFLVGQGVIQNLAPYKAVTTLEATVYQQPRLGRDGQPAKDAAGQPVLETLTTPTQTLAMGPVASQEAIKMLGTNGGGFFNANSAHPYENPTPLSNLAQMLAIFLIPAALCLSFGQMVG
ncbi:potassium-transporting ATPase subunit KdpA, partial [Stenotrophomonas sp. YIM B06876]|uniref:potassium-transporting ATPase subunit KdpA n=1 Tax=Stenotrophomonas sp. YIM B06876 TaxID=3060211 RepID=UPI0027387FA7